MASDIAVLQEDFFYPLGEEHLLLQRILGVSLDSREIPAEHGILVFNVQTVLMIGYAAVSGRKTPFRYLTAATLITDVARIVRAPLGMDAGKILSAAFEQPGNSKAYIGDGP